MIKTVYDMLSNPSVTWPVDAFKITVTDWTTDPETPATVTLGENTDVVMYMKKMYKRQGYYYEYDTAGSIESDFLYSWQAYIRREQDNFDRIYNALLQEYDPIANYDRNEDSTMTRTGSWTDALQHGETVTDTKGQYATAGSVSTYDGTVKPYTSTTQGHSAGQNDTSAHTGTDTRTITHNSDKDTYKSHITGNIGVTTSQQMIESEIQLRQYDLMEEIIKKFIRTYCFTWWGEGCT